DAPDDIHKGDENAGNGVTPDELAGTVHGPVKIGLLLNRLAPSPGLLLIDQAGVEISINGHLLAGHGIEGKTRCHFGNTPRTLRHDDKVDHDENAKYDDSNPEIAADDKVPKGFDDRSGGVWTLIAMQQDQAHRRDVEGQPEQGQEQQ